MPDTNGTELAGSPKLAIRPLRLPLLDLRKVAAEKIRHLLGGAAVSQAVPADRLAFVHAAFGLSMLPS
jgi:hypothetical protein